MFSDPIAHFLTWPGHGTRLHGDPRGTVDRWHNQFDSPRLATDPLRHNLAASSINNSAVRLGARERPVVEAAIRDHCQHRGWPIHALNVRTTHVHVVASSGRYTPELMMDQLKSWGTRRLRAARLLGADAPSWAAGGSTVYVWDEEGLREVVNYVQYRQGVDLDEPLPAFHPVAPSFSRARQA